MSTSVAGSSIPPQEPIAFRTVRPTELGVEYWERTAQGELPLRVCSDCGQARIYLTSVCPQCHGRDSTWTTSAGEGTVFVSTVVRYRLSPEFPDSYVFALIDLDEGVRMMANVLQDGEPELVPIGSRVRLTFEELPSGQHLPQFVLADSANSRRPGRRDH
ncbi:Zn-ribbon domain-containing OB-fold protein [Dactylosporangium sp. CA-233914]|uniref:Zn-ribbon domain-containing OB-fold protein n=1 Tax=Dactylosporangium sp. CA-233914 TaxID=3239934 RepID=UPI003D8E9841